MRSLQTGKPNATFSLTSRIIVSTRYVNTVIGRIGSFNNRYGSSAAGG